MSHQGGLNLMISQRSTQTRIRGADNTSDIER